MGNQKQSLTPLRLEFHRYGDAEAYRLGKQIEQKLQPHWPKEIAELRFNTGLDHTGDPALWIWVFLTEDVSKDDETFLRAAQWLPTILDPIARRVAPDRWPYLSFRPIAEPPRPWRRHESPRRAPGPGRATRPARPQTSQAGESSSCRLISLLRVVPSARVGGIGPLRR